MDSNTATTEGALVEAAKRVRAELRHLEGTHRLARYRQESPELLEGIDDVVAVLDSVDPLRPLPPETV